MRFEEAVEIIEKIAPPELAEPWDNSGVQLRMTDDVTKILFALEITDGVIEEALEKGCDMIVSHHPLLFDEMRSIDPAACDAARARQADLAVKLIRSGISVYSAHTSFDSAPEGNNVYLMRLLGAEDIEGPGEGLEGCLGDLPEETDLASFREKVRSALGLPAEAVRAAGNGAGVIKRVAVCTGAGGVFIDAAAANGADVLVTGDVKFDQVHKALHHGLAVIDAGHFGTEKIFEENFKKQFDGFGSGILTFVSDRCTDPWTVF